MGDPSIPSSSDSLDSSQARLGTSKQEELEQGALASVDEHKQNPNASMWLSCWVGVASSLFLALSSTRHWLFQSTAFDLGIYDQVTYLMSQGQPPISSFLGFHHLGNHGAWAVYPLGLLYAIHPSVYWLLGVQALGLVSGMIPTWMLAKQAGLSETQSRMMALVYLGYPVIFNLNLFDFHPEVMAIAPLLYGIWAARAGKVIPFTVAIVWVLGCKDAWSLTVAAMGLWLLLFDRRRKCGAIALILGMGWFLFVTQWMLPFFSGEEAAAVDRYSFLGDSVLEIAINVVLKPGLVLGQAWSLDSLRYIGKLLVPVLWGLSPFHLAPLLSGLPALFLNIISVVDTQRDLIHQYSLPILPFLLVCVVDALAARQTLLHHRRWVLMWVLVTFLYFSEVQHLPRRYSAFTDTLTANRQAVSLIPPQVPVLTDNRLGVHLTHRPVVKLVQGRMLADDLNTVDYIWLDSVHPWPLREKLIERLIPRLKKQRSFDLTFEQDGVYLFRRRSP